MKRIISLALIASFVLAFGATLTAQSLVDNSYYRKSLELRALAAQAFDEGDYDAAATYANQARDYARLSDEYVEKMVAMTAADRSLAAARKGIARAEAAGAAELAADQYGQANAFLSVAEEAYNSESFAEAKESGDKAAESATAALAAAKSVAETAIGEARGRLAWADSIKAQENWPDEYGRAKTEFAAAEAAFGAVKYAEAKTRAEAVLAALAALNDELPLPATYTVRLIPSRRDCLWRIAEYPFIYGNPLKWPVIYEANKKTFKDPNNPNLIFPGQVLVIPSINGETRKGAFDPTKTYPKASSVK